MTKVIHEEGLQLFIGQVVLKVLGLVVDPRMRKPMPNSASPETPMIDIFMATSPNSGMRSATSKSCPRQTSFIHWALDENCYFMKAVEGKEDQ